MSDKLMCNKCTCAAKKSCARFNPNPERGQVMFASHPMANVHGSCDHFVANDERSDLHVEGCHWSTAEYGEHTEIVMWCNS